MGTIEIIMKSLESSSKHLPMIYQRFTKNKAIFGILPSKNLPRIYQRFTKDLPKIYQVYQTLTKSYKIFFSIYQRFTNNLPKIFGLSADLGLLVSSKAGGEEVETQE